MNNYNRRNFISIGSLFLGSYSIGLPNILKAASESKKSSKNIINIFLAGGPSHLDLWDLKPDAPSEIRGHFNPIKTNISGIELCEVFQELSKRMDKGTILRSIVESHGDHASFQCMTGWKPDNLKSIGGRPSIGSVVTKLNPSIEPSMPTYISLAEPTKHLPWSDGGNGGFLGATLNPFRPNGEGLNDMKLNIDTSRLNNRKILLSKLDNLKQTIDHQNLLQTYNQYIQTSFDILTDNKLLQALDLSSVDPNTLEKYGNGQPYQFQFDGAPTNNLQLLMAKRLIEAGTKVVSLSYGRWDSHGNNFDLIKDHGSKLDQCLSALIDDLDESGLLEDTMIIVWGEFGRTPKINKDAGRDHWPQVNGAMIFGGKFKHGQVIGSTNRLGEYAQDRPIHFQEVVATMYNHIGIDIASTTIIDTTGRPQYLVEHQPIKELF